MDTKVLDQINAVSLIVFVVAAVLILIKIGARYVRYRRSHLKVPELLPRDFFLFFGLIIPFAGILLIRAAGVVDARLQWWYPLWIIASDIAGVVGILNWLYYEYFKIEK